MKEISVFGEDARNIEEGQIFRAIKVEIEQGDKVILVPIKDPLNGRKENDLIKKEMLLDWN